MGDVTVAVHLGPDELTESLRHDAWAGLTASPKSLPAKWFYDERGSQLFDQITRLPEYYPTRTERAILADHAAEIATESRADTLVELGSGTSEKTGLLLDALAAAGTLRRVVLLDVSEEILRQAAAGIADRYDGVDVHAVVGDFERHLGAVPPSDRRLVVFLGGTIGNFEPNPRARFLQAIRQILDGGDTFLLGTDLVKDAGRLEAAYDDADGVTAEFNRNVLSVLNRKLGADFEPRRFEHVAIFDREQSWIEMRLRSLFDQWVRLEALDLDVHFGAGEEMRTEISAKFTPLGVENELKAAGMRLLAWWTDAAGDFGVSLSAPRLR